MAKNWFDDILDVSGSEGGIDLPGGDDVPTGEKPNPSLAGTSRFAHSVLWLESEREILDWWETVREDLRVPIAMNLRDSALLHYEKEVLEWWHNIRGDFGYV